MRRFAMGLVLLAAPLLAHCQTRPNVVLITTDGAGYGDFGFTGSNQIQTKHIDWMARYGCVFERAYLSGTLSSPARAGLLTGRYQSRFGHDHDIGEGTVHPLEDPAEIGLPTNEKTIADYLSKEGYVCAIFGKWHLGEADKFHPKNHRFDYWYFFRGASRPYFDKDVLPGDDIETNQPGAQPVSYLTDDLGREAARFIRAHAEGRYFVHVSFSAPHAPLQAKPEDLVGLGHIRSVPRRNYVGMMKAVDRAVGTVLRAIEDTGKERDTMIVFLNASGGLTDAGAVNAPFRGTGGTLLEGGVRVPMIVRYPRLVPLPVRRSYPVVSVDVLPTILGASGIEPSQNQLHALDGVDLVPYITGRLAERPHDDVYWRMGAFAAVRSGDWKLIRLPHRLPLLYDLAKDPYEANNLVLDYPTRASDLLERLFRWESGLGPALWEPHPLKTTEIAGLYNRVWRLTQPDD